jgi:F-type H+-transporting ATPase subunit delta
VPSSSNVARRYATGAFELAQEQHGLDEWRKEMAMLDELLQDEVLVAAFQNPAVSVPRRIDLVQRIAPDLRPETRNFLRLLIEHRRTRLMHAIRLEFERLADEASGIVHATVTTAIPLDAADEQRYQHALARRFGRQVTVNFRRDPGIIGGALLQIGDYLVDGSVRTQLERLRQDLLS